MVAADLRPIFESVTFAFMATLGNGWLGWDVFCQNKEMAKRNLLSIIVAGLVITNLSIQATWSMRGTWMNLRLGTGQRHVTISQEDRDAAFFACLATAALLSLASILRRTLKMLAGLPWPGQASSQQASWNPGISRPDRSFVVEEPPPNKES